MTVNDISKKAGQHPTRRPNRPKPAGRDYTQVTGWGVDLDPENRSAYPKELPSDVWNVRGPVGARQVPDAKVHLSVEHPDLTPVFGNSRPAKGLSGLLRDYAYKFGEGANRHWMTLMLADRVDVIESMVTDALRGRPDNYIREKGWPAKLKYADAETRKRYMVMGAAAVGVVTLAMLLRYSSRDDD
jgi:hypothetical protein